ncbi:MAG: hypothetical protein COA47_10345 [Robiginitomaculum sp.]|nr:MAG: hypothetical protein COA47_10345 [Robiginitomaculum sp.]
MKIDVQFFKINLTAGYCGSEKDHDKFCEKFVAFGIETKPYDKESHWGSPFVEGSDIVVDKERLVELVVAGVEFKVEGDLKSSVTIGKDLEDMCNKVGDRLAGTAPVEPGNYNVKCEVHQPGQALSMYNNVLLLEDACTDRLNDHLEQGWRMVAACPQPEQRRPDYIMGRYVAPS